MEWVQFCADLSAELLLDIYAGYSLNGESVVQGDLQPYIDEVLNELEYLLGNASTTYGALRISHGYPDPIALKYVEIGNEDFFSSTYNYRWPAYYSQLSAAYPNITFIATTVENIDLPAGVIWDQHQYGDSNIFTGLFAAYDNYPRDNGTQVLVGEYSVQRLDNQTGAPYPFMEAAVAEAVYRIGIERNADVVISALYAPFLASLKYNQEVSLCFIIPVRSHSSRLFQLCLSLLLSP